MATAANIVVGSRCHVYVAPVGTAAPTDVTTAMAAPWVDLGYFTPDSLNFAEEPTYEDVNTAQSDFPARKFQTKDSGKISVDLQEWSTAVLKAVNGGGTVTTATGTSTFTPPLLGARVATAVVIEVIDGSNKFRYVIPQAFQESGVNFDLHKGKEAVLPLRLALLGSDGVAAWYVLTNMASII